MVTTRPLASAAVVGAIARVLGAARTAGAGVGGASTRGDGSRRVVPQSLQLLQGQPSQSQSGACGRSMSEDSTGPQQP